MKQLRVEHGSGSTVFRDNPQIDFQGEALIVFADRARTEIIGVFAGGAWGIALIEDQEDL